ncbi:hypothetical protein TNCT_379401 [Trichonephila clavata]|uniref:Uncharacterized protein n=1 Tax=Trichonephila clavata TaxID=2740835 RepID=A0A8X6IW81_TRICU|nr:hypothetical protein TNCT_379401 [Trichonephila clavata]
MCNFETQDSSVTSSSNVKKPTKTCTSPGKNSLPNSLPKIFQNPETDQNKKVPLQKNVTEFRISERGSELSSSFNFFKLIPPSSKKDIIHLKKFILDDDIQERTYKAALRYPDGINKLLKVLEHMGRFNEKYAEKRSAEEKKFMKWLNIITAKIKYFHLAKISNIEPHYKPALEEIRKIQIENVNIKPKDAIATSKKYRSEDSNPIDSQRKITNNSSKILKRCVSRTGDQCQDKYKHSPEIAEHGSVLSKIDRNPSHQNNIHISGTCNNKNSKPFSQTEAKNRLKCSSGIKNDNSEIATKRVQPQKSFDAVPEKPETNLIDVIINEIYLRHNKNARQTELSAQNSKKISPVQNNSSRIHTNQRTLTSEKTDLQINGSKQNFSLKATDEFGSQNLKSEPCFTARNFPVAVKREPNESSSENTLFQASDALFSGFLKKKIKTEVIEEVEKDIKKQNDATITGNLFFSI